MKAHARLFTAICMLATFAAHAALDPNLSGAWYDPAHEGSGFLVEVLENDRAVVYWFTYDETGAQQWFIGVGATDDLGIHIENLQASSGARFGVDFDADDVSLRSVGSLDLEFADCRRGAAQFSVDGQVGEQTLQRLTEIRDLGCASSNEPPSLNQSASWFNPDRAGEGFIVEVLDTQTAFVNWFTYKPSGEAAWFTGLAHVAGQSLVVDDLLVTSGGRFDDSHDPTAVARTNVGRLELYLGCDGGRANYDMANGWSSGFHPIEPLTRIRGLGCAEDQFATPDLNALIGLWQSDGFGTAAAVTDEIVVFFQTTAVSCLPVLEAPTAALAMSLKDIRINQDHDRLEFLGLDAVTPVYLDRVDRLPPACADGGTAFTTDPTHNYEVFAATYAELYAAFDVRGVNWSDRQRIFAPQVNPGTSFNQLFQVFSGMLAPLRDLHTTIHTGDRFFGSGVTPANQAYFERAQSAEIGAIVDRYLVTPRMLAAGGTLNYGLLENGAGYIEARSFSVDVGGSTGSERLAFYRREVDRILRYFDTRGVTGIILDVRRNEGGDTAFGFELASRFLRGRTRTVFSEQRLAGGALTDPCVQTIDPSSARTYDGDVVLLIGRITGSAAETFTLAIRALPHAVLIGEPTAGVLSRTERVLPNGWIVSLTVGQIRTPEGEYFEAHGISPDIEEPVYQEADLMARRDPALEQALAL